MTYYTLAAEPYGIPLQAIGGPPLKKLPDFVPSDLARRIEDWNIEATTLIAQSDRFEQGEWMRLIEENNKFGIELLVALRVSSPVDVFQFLPVE